MKQFVLFMFSLYSSSVLAVVNGTPVDWPSHDNTVKINGCTGTTVAGNYVLTAAHCQSAEGIFYSVLDVNDNTYSQAYGDIEASYIHPNYEANMITEDVALAKLARPIDYRRIQFFKDLNASTFEQDESITIDGFGGTGIELNQATFKLDSYPSNYPFYMSAVQLSESYVTNGDSGSAWINSNNEIIAVLQGGGFYDDINLHKTSGIDLHYARDFLLEHIDGWHYPTVVDANGRTTVEVQSMHINGVSDSAYITGDATLITDESSCVGATIRAFERCTYVIESSGGEGALYLSANEIIKLNPVSESESTSSSDGGSSGGSMGLLWLLGLIGLGTYRRKRA